MVQFKLGISIDWGMNIENEKFVREECITCK